MRQEKHVHGRSPIIRRMDGSAPSGPGRLPVRRLGHTSLMVTSVCVGGSPLGSVPQVFGEDVEYERGLETVRHIFDSPFNFLDTANGYSNGESERRIGAVIAERGGLPDGFVLATKIDRDPQTGDFSGDRARRSADESLERLGISQFQLLYLHDPENISFEEAMAPGGPVEALVALREAGTAQHIGVAGGPVRLMSRFLGTGAFEVVLTHNRFTLLERSADALISEATTAGIGVVNAAVYGGGILAKGPGHTEQYGYHQASPEVIALVRAMESACRTYGVPLRAAALQVSLRDARINSTIVGSASPAHVDELVELMSLPVPVPLWDELSHLVAPETEWLF
jgi:D-threo-aldose 1-dehydrogenase